MPQIRTIHYATPPENYFWHWSDSYDAIEFADGKTCTLWEEVQPVLGYLAAETGLPPLGSIVLLVAACREDWLTFYDSLYDWARKLHNLESFYGLINCLELLRALPDNLRQSTEAKCAIIVAVFEDSPQLLTLTESDATVTELTRNRPACLKWSHCDLSEFARFQRDIKGIIRGLEGRTTDSLENRLRTGIDRIDLKKAEVPFEDREHFEPANLLDALKQSGEEGKKLAGIAERAIAMVHFPGRLDIPDELPVGGIADITNRGTFDRLLPGELVWDDLTLAVRIINGEALYYRREVPPQDSPKRNAIFIDRGLQLWGVTRLFTLGVALGISQQPQWGQQDLSVFAVNHPASWRPADLSDLGSIKKLLSELIPLPNPAIPLSEWWSVQSEEINGDVALISIREHVSEASTIQILSKIATEISSRNAHLYVITVNREGAVEMDIWSSGGIRPGLRAKIDLEELFESREKPEKSPAGELIHEIPEPARSYPFYRLDLPPLLFPVSPQFHQSSIGVPNGLVSWVEDRLFRWSEPGKGAREIYSGLPGSRRWLCDNGGELILAVAGDPGDPMRVFRVYPGELKSLPIDRSRHSFPRKVQIDGGALIFGYEDYVEAFSLDTGGRIAGTSIAGLWQDPVFHFDGEKLEVLKGVPKTNLNEAFFTDEKWEGLIEPRYVKWMGENLYLLTDEKIYCLDSVNLRWEDHIEVRQLRDDCHKFDPYPVDGFSGIDFRKARLGKSAEALIDSRGILHIANHDNPGMEAVSLLLLKGDTSAWSESLGVFSKNDRLVPSGVGFSFQNVSKVFNLRLESLCGR